MRRQGVTKAGVAALALGFLALCCACSPGPQYFNNTVEPIPEKASSATSNALAPQRAAPKYFTVDDVGYQDGLFLNCQDTPIAPEYYFNQQLNACVQVVNFCEVQFLQTYFGGQFVFDQNRVCSMQR